MMKSNSTWLDTPAVDLSVCYNDDDTFVKAYNE
jgi:hypothetical protein